MKNFLASILLLFAATAGHAGLLLTYIGNQTVRVSNTGACLADVRLKWDRQGGNDTSFLLAANASGNIILPGLSLGDKVRVKSEGPCSSGGWVEITISAVLSIPPVLAAQKGKDGIFFTLSQPGILEKSTNGTTYISLGTFDRTALDPAPAERTFYRLRAGGQLSAVLLIISPPTLYFVYNRGGQLVDRTTARHKWGPAYIYRQ
jgi:hypothetical protein